MLDNPSTSSQYQDEPRETQETSNIQEELSKDDLSSSEEESYYSISSNDFSDSNHAELVYDRTPPRTKRLVKTKGKKQKFKGSTKCQSNSEEEEPKFIDPPYELPNQFFKNQKNIIYLTESTHEQIFASIDLLLVMFYQPWCSSDQETVQEFVKAADELKRMNYKGRLGICDVSENRRLQNRFTGYSKGKCQLFKGGVHVEDYSDKETAGRFKLFMIHYEKYNRPIGKTS